MLSRQFIGFRERKFNFCRCFALKVKINANLEKLRENQEKKLLAQGGYLKSSTAFRRKSKRKMASTGPVGPNANEKKYEEWSQYAAVINPEMKPVQRTREQIAEAVTMTKMFQKQNWIKDKTFHRREHSRILLMRAAFEDLPEDAKEEASKVDESDLPDNFVMTRSSLPVVGEVLFGKCNAPGYHQEIDEYGYPPDIPKLRKTPF